MPPNIIYFNARVAGPKGPAVLRRGKNWNLPVVIIRLPGKIIFNYFNPATDRPNYRPVRGLKSLGNFFSKPGLLNFRQPALNPNILLTAPADEKTLHQLPKLAGQNFIFARQPETSTFSPGRPFAQLAEPVFPTLKIYPASGFLSEIEIVPARLFEVSGENFAQTSHPTVSFLLTPLIPAASHKPESSTDLKENRIPDVMSGDSVFEEIIRELMQEINALQFPPADVHRHITPADDPVSLAA